MTIHTGYHAPSRPRVDIGFGPTGNVKRVEHRNSFSSYEFHPILDVKSYELTFNNFYNRNDEMIEIHCDLTIDRTSGEQPPTCHVQT